MTKTPWPLWRNTQTSIGKVYGITENLSIRECDNLLGRSNSMGLGPKSSGTIGKVLWQTLFALSYLALVAAQGVTEYPPEISEHPMPGQPPIEGSSKRLTCNAVAIPSAVFSWFHNGRLIGQNSSIGSLGLQYLNTSYNGEYRCLASNRLGAELSQAAIIQVAALRPFPLLETQEVSVDQGKAIILPLPPIDRLALDLSWVQNNVTALQETDTFHRVTINSSLVLLSVDLDQNGKEYRAKAEYFFSGFVSWSSPYRLRVRDASNPTNIAPEVIVPPVDTFSTAGDEKVQLECVINARPITYLTINWYRENVDGSWEEILPITNKYILTAYRRSLIIKEVVEADSGRYQCEGVLNVPGMSVSFTPATASARLIVQVPPRLLSGLQPKIVERDFSQTATLLCQAQGVPQPTLHWYFNGRNISTVTTARHTVHSNGTLEIRNLDLPDAGKYQCFARNSAGEAYQAVWLKVNSAPPHIVKAPENLTIVELSDARFFCGVTGAPSPQITWTKVLGGVEQPVVIGGRFQVFPDSLLIANVEKADSGVYKCTASNIKGTESAQAQLVVITKTQIIRPPQNQTVILSTLVHFECGISRDDNTVPVWEWFFYKNGELNNEKQLTSTGRYQIADDGTLQISGVSAQDIGMYKCHVISAGGNDSRAAYLRVIQLPRAPTITSVVLNPFENRSVIVTWTAAFDGNSPLLKYIITYRQENPNGNNDAVRWEVYPENIAPAATSHVVSNLRPSRYYRFRVSAVNTVGEGDASVPMPNPAIKMPTQPPSAPPKNFFCTQIDNRNVIKATWKQPDENTLNGDLLGYVIRYKVANLPDSTMQNLSLLGPDRRFYTIESLVFFQQYAVSIAAYNEEGVGVFSNPFYIWTPQGRPTDHPHNVNAIAISSTSVQLQWDPPNPAEINGENLGYIIEIYQGNDLVRNYSVGSNATNPEGRQETVVYELQKFTVYTIKLACRTDPGAGPYSVPISVQTKEDVPGPVHDLSFDNVRDRSLTVRWSAPTEVNGILLGYILKYENKSEPNVLHSVDLPQEATSFTVQNLRPITNYTIYVAATTVMGTGQWVSADIQSDVPPELPGPPHNLGISNIRERTVFLQFFPGFDGKTSITLWIVLAKEADEQDYREIYSISDPQARGILVQNLKPYTKYQLKLIAENIVGPSIPSEPTREFETLQAPPGSPPGNVTVRALNSTALRISWTPIPSQEWNGAPRGYKIDFRMWSVEEEDAGLASVQEAEWTTVQLENGINIDSYILPGLQEWMDYEIRMVSYNDVGVSPYSPVKAARTRESTPSASPSQLSATALSSTQILVTWSPVPRLEQNGQILGYKVLYKPQYQTNNLLFQDVQGKGAANVTLAGLLKYVVYQVQILAYTRMGDGVLSSKAITRTDEDVPGPPIIIYFPNVTYTSAVVVWSSPSEPNGIITGYKVAYRKNSNSAPGPEVELGPNIREYSVDTLERETVYVFSVTAKTQLGWGETASVEVLTMVNRDRPDQPSQPTIGNLQVSARYITIAWRPGTDNYSPIRNYTVQYKIQGGVWTTFPETIPPSSTSYTITGLRPNSWYQFQVAATNDIGTSDYSLPSAEVPTLSDKPDGAPQNLRVVAVTRTSIRAFWERPEEDTWNGLLLSYVVQFRQIQQQDFQEDNVEFGTETVLLSNLVISQTYEIQVLAVNAKGRGPPSTPATIYVGEAAPTAPPVSVHAVNKSSSSIEVTWLEPPPETQNGGLSGYKVLFYKNTSGPAEEKQRISAETRLVLEGLETFTYYLISVQGYNLAGEGPRSDTISARTSEGVPGAPGPLRFTNITMRKLTVSFEPPLHPNGYILLYEMEYFPTQRNPFDPLPPRRILRANQTRVVVEGLEKNVEYTFKVSANTSVGRGDTKEADIQTGPQPGSPSAPGRPHVSQKDSAHLLVEWTEGKTGDSPTYGYLVQNRKGEEDEFETLQHRFNSETSTEVSLTRLNPNTNYQFRIIAINDHGISDPSVPSKVFVTPSLAVPKVAKPFHAEWWFIVIVALTMIIIILVIISLLCLMWRQKKAGKEMKRSQTTITVVSEPSEPEDGGFPSYEMRQSRRNIAPRNGSVKNIYARPPPRPSPASVAYSEDEDDAMSTAKPPIPDDNSSSVTDKPSDFGDSTEPSDEESDAESEKVPASPPPPAFSSVYANSDNVRQSWRFQSPYNAYTYTDSEADSSHYAFSLNNGQLVVNNVAGARTPLTGFSSFV